MQFSDRYEQDIEVVRSLWRQYLWAAHRGAAPQVHLLTAFAKFNRWLEATGRRPTMLPIFRSVWLGRE